MAIVWDDTFNLLVCFSVGALWGCACSGVFFGGDDCWLEGWEGTGAFAIQCQLKMYALM